MNLIIFFSSLTSHNFWVCVVASVQLGEQNLPEDFSGCENFGNLRKFAGCEISQPDTVHLLPTTLYFPSTLRFTLLKLKFYYLLSHAIDGH